LLLNASLVHCHAIKIFDGGVPFIMLFASWRFTNAILIAAADSGETTSSNYKIDENARARTHTYVERGDGM
jgi:hypothetical protein